MNTTVLVVAALLGWALGACAAYSLVRRMVKQDCLEVWSVGDRNLWLCISLLLGPFGMIVAILVTALISIADNERPSKW